MWGPSAAWAEPQGACRAGTLLLLLAACGLAGLWLTTETARGGLQWSRASSQPARFVVPRKLRLATTPSVASLSRYQYDGTEVTAGDIVTGDKGELIPGTEIILVASAEAGADGSESGATSRGGEALILSQAEGFTFGPEDSSAAAAEEGAAGAAGLDARDGEGVDELTAALESALGAAVGDGGPAEGGLFPSEGAQLI